ncbi:hypothetical protein HYU92_01610 [Candidatus Curtissbacteria bacterium]|nr:hypothetical protein [Candidatus Curtissbacteria bacterium]
MLRGPTSENKKSFLEVGPQDHIVWEIPPDFQGIMNYNPRHDIQDFLDLKNLNGKIPPLEYERLQNQVINRTKRQLEKAIGERFGVEKSTVVYFIKDGRLKSPDYPEPVVERYEKGRKFLAENGSTETAREAAEVEGIKKVQKLLANLTNTSETKIIIISPIGPAGSLYHDNIFYVVEQKDGLFEMTRFHSTLDYPGFLQAARTADPNYELPQEGKQITAAHFLINPAQTNKNLEEILEVFSLDQDTQPYSECLKVIEECTPLILSYINTLAENPVNINKIKSQINEIFTASDVATYKFQRSKQIVPCATYQIELSQYFEKFAPTGINFEQSGSDDPMPTRPVNHGCPGGQRGFSTGQSPQQLISLGLLIGASSVIDFAPFYRSNAQEDTSDFQCPGFKKDGTKCTYIVRYGSGIRKCPECETEATCG